MDDPAPPSTIDEYAAGAKKIAREAAAVFGEFPAFDFGTYTFVACYRPSCNGDGMEHRNSTSVTGHASMGTSPLRELGTVAHEFFHAWNVKRIRPATLEPFDFDRANMSGELWIAEGFTQYYGPLLEARSGVTPARAFVRALGGTVNTVTNAPGRRYYGPIGMSQQAPFTDAAVSIDPQNRANIFISYYTYGAGIALAIDLSLRSRGAQDAGRLHARDVEEPRQAGDPLHARRRAARARDRVRRLGVGVGLLEAVRRGTRTARLSDAARERRHCSCARRSRARAWIGDYRVRPAQPNQAASAPLTINSSVLVGSPLYDAGLDRGDRILALDGKDGGLGRRFPRGHGGAQAGRQGRRSRTRGVPAAATRALTRRRESRRAGGHVRGRGPHAERCSSSRSARSG